MAVKGVTGVLTVMGYLVRSEVEGAFQFWTHTDTRLFTPTCQFASVMDRCHSRVCLLDSDDLDCLHQQHENRDAESSSSGYDSSDNSSDEDVVPVISRPAQTFSTSHVQSSEREDVMVFRSTRDLQTSLAFILNMPEMCDVTFLAGKKQVPVHGVKAILATRSRCLYQVILKHQRQMDEEGVSKRSKKHKHSPTQHRLVINVMDYKVEDFRQFVTFVHSGKVNVDLKSVVGLLCAAVEFDFPDLRAACTDYIRRCQVQDQSSSLLDYAWDYQHKRVSQKLICQVCRDESAQ